MTTTDTAIKWAVRYHDDVEEISPADDELTARTLAADFNRTSGPAWAEPVYTDDNGSTWKAAK